MKDFNMVAIDLSMRSTGIVCLTPQNKLIDFKIISAKKLEDEELLIWNANEIIKFCKKNKPSYIVIEGLAYLAKSSRLDVIHGNFWNVRCEIKREFKNISVGVIPVLSWRNDLLSKEERKSAKEIGREGIKIAVVDKLLKNVKVNFENYIKKNKFSKKAIFDLADAFFLGCYRNKL